MNEQQVGCQGSKGRYDRDREAARCELAALLARGRRCVSSRRSAASLAARRVAVAGRAGVLRPSHVVTTGAGETLHSTSMSAGGTDADAGETVTGTSSSSVTTGGAGGQESWPRTESHACLAYVLGFCEYTARCNVGASDVSACFESSSAACPDLLFAPGSTRNVDGTFACADEWRALDCETPTPECATAGTLADFEACVSGIQCASRLCSGNIEACGNCLPSADLGEACDDALGPQCKPGYLCDGAEAVCVAVTNSPTEPHAIGDECDPTSGTDCYPNDCRADDAGVYRCQPYPTLGQDCSDPLTCAFGDSYCDISQVCLALPTDGEPCGVDGFTGMAQWCADDMFCDNTQEPPVCAPRAGPGETCDGACQAGLSCRCTDEACSSRLCQRPRVHGQTCTSPQDGCVLGECVNGTCVVPELESRFEEVCAE